MPLKVDPTLAHQASEQRALQQNQPSTEGGAQRSSSPVPPSASPLSPAIKPALPVPSAIAPLNGQVSQQGHHQPRPHAAPQLIDRPPALPFSGEDATDAIALRAAISSLQYQKQKAEQDIKALRKIRDDAIARPDEFQQHILDVAKQQAQPPKDFDFSLKGHSDDEMDESDNEGASKTGPPQSKPAFPPFPLPQDVVRCPPINWDKYHIVGEPLDRMHNAQQNGSAAGLEANAVARPYDPVLDKLEKRPGPKVTAPPDNKKAARASAGSRRGSRA